MFGFVILCLTVENIEPSTKQKININIFIGFEIFEGGFIFTQILVIVPNPIMQYQYNNFYVNNKIAIQNSTKMTVKMIHVNIEKMKSTSKIISTRCKNRLTVVELVDASCI